MDFREDEPFLEQNTQKQHVNRSSTLKLKYIFGLLTLVGSTQLCRHQFGFYTQDLRLMDSFCHLQAFDHVQYFHKNLREEFYGNGGSAVTQEKITFTISIGFSIYLMILFQNQILLLSMLELGVTPNLAKTYWSLMLLRSLAVMGTNILRLNLEVFLNGQAVD